MMKHLYLSILAITSVFYALIVDAEIYKHVDENGRVTYSNVKMSGAKKLDIEQPASRNLSGNASANPTNSVKLPTPSNFPKISPETQDQRDDKRKGVLQTELDAEKKALGDAKKAYAEGESSPEVYRGANGKTFRNVSKFEEKMKKLKEEVDSHQRNVEMLEKEINRIK